MNKVKIIAGCLVVGLLLAFFGVGLFIYKYRGNNKPHANLPRSPVQQNKQQQPQDKPTLLRPEETSKHPLFIAQLSQHPTKESISKEVLNRMVPDGMVRDKKGHYAWPDVCPNLPGIQTEVPKGRVRDGKGTCLFCTNLPEVKDRIPDGMVRDEKGSCTLPDVCPNLPGVQKEIPRGWAEEGGNCVPLRTLSQQQQWRLDCGTVMDRTRCKNRCIQNSVTRRDCDKLYGPGRFD